MLRCTVLFLSAATLLAQAGVSSAQSFSDYQRALQNSRRQSLEQYQQWQRNRLNRYQQVHGTRAPSRSGFALDLPRADVPAGSYNVQLPGGLNFRVNVGEGRRSGAWVDGNYVDLAEMADQLHDRVRDVQLVLTRQGQLQPFQNDILIAREALSAMKKAIENRDDPQRVHALFERFDELWHPLAHELLSRFGEASPVGQQVALAGQIDDSFHQLLNISPASVYDTVQLAALTYRLDETTSRLQEELGRDGRRLAADARLARQADRVHRHAHDLHEVVSQGSAFSVVQDEYAQFDAAWHRLASLAGSVPIDNPEARRLFHDVWQIDQALHEQLLVDSPIAGHDQRAAHRAEHIARTAEFLAAELSWELGRPGYHEAIDAAENLAQAARNVHAELSEHRSPNRASREIRLVREWWQYLDDQMRTLDQRRFRDAFAIAADLETHVTRLERSLR